MRVHGDNVMIIIIISKTYINTLIVGATNRKYYISISALVIGIYFGFVYLYFCRFQFIIVIEQK